MLVPTFPKKTIIKLSGNGEKRLDQGEMPFGAGGHTLATGLLRFLTCPYRHSPSPPRM